MRERTMERITSSKIVRVLMAMALALSVAVVPSTAQAAGPAYESGRGVTFAEKLGFDPEAFVANLEAHQDRYLGTPYTMDDREAGPGAGMDCSTFVSYALINEAGVSDSFLRYDMQPRHWDDNCLPNTETLYNWAFSNCDVQVFSSKADLLASKPAKGDILFVWAKSAGDTPVGGGESHVGIYWGEGNGEDLMFHAIPPVCKIGPIEGKVVGDLYYAKVTVSHGFDLTVDKSAGDTIVLDTEGNGQYATSLEGAQYGVYADEACTDKVASITISKSGSGYSGTAEGLDPGTYWVKETKAPSGYALDPTVQQVVLEDDMSISSSEEKQYFPIDVSITKLARDGKPTPEGDASFAGAKFRIDYPNGKTGVYQTNADGKISMKVDDGAFVEGEPMDVIDGMYVMQLGTYSVTEIEAPEGCVIPENATQTIEVTATSQLTTTSTKATFSNEFEGTLGYVQTPALGSVMVAKGDALLFDEEDTEGDGTYYNYAQGDATLAGAEFTIYNASAERVDVDLNDNGVIDEGEVFAAGDAIITIATEYDTDLDAFIAKTPEQLLPYGTYLVRETKAPQGYTEDGATQKEFQVREDGKVYEFLLADGELNEVAAGGVQVVKSDLELGVSEALGGNSHDTLDTGSTLSGIEFTITNASEHGVMVNGQWFHVGDAVMTITTHWNEDMQAYTAETSFDALPYGTYTIQETATNDSYLLTDGEPRTFEVRADGEIVSASKDGNVLEFFNQVVRNDIELAKMADDTNAAQQVAFKVTNVSTGEAHVIVTDRNGDFSSASGWTKHSNNTNGNDHLMDAGYITADMMDAKAGTWFFMGEDGTEAEVDDSLAAFPYGEYTLEELRSDTNEGYQLIERTFWVERDSSVARAVWMSLDDQPGADIGTMATDKSDGDKFVWGSEVVIADEVFHDGLTPGETYTLEATLMDADTGEAVKNGSGPLAEDVTGTVTFTAERETGSQVVELSLNTSELAGKRLVVFEKLYDANGEVVATHEDINDEGQSVTVIEIGTTLVDAADGDHVVENGTVKVVDTVAYKGLTAGETYTAHGTIMNKATGMPLEDADGNPVTATAEFVAEGSEGTVEVTFEFDASALEEGAALVAFEEVLDVDGNVVAVHQDLEDEGQTVVVDNPDTPEVPTAPYDKTGADLLPAWVLVCALVVSGAAAGAYALRNRIRRDAEGAELNSDKATDE